MLTDFFVRNLDIVFFFYGLSFAVMAIAILVQPRRKSIFRLADVIWILAGFGITHGINEWLDMFAIIKWPHSNLFNLIRLVILAISFIFLYEFGRRLISLETKEVLNKWSTVILCFLVLVGILVFKQEPSIWLRYLLCLPGGILSAFGFMRYYQRNKTILAPTKVQRYFFIAAFSIGIYSVVGGIVVPQANFPPSSIINTASFLRLFGMPVQLFRTFCAIFLAWSIGHILTIFNWETNHTLTSLLEKTSAAKAALEKAYNELEMKHFELKATQSQLIQAEKMEIVGRLASGVAHEVKNPLAIILQSVDYLSSNISTDNENISLALKYMKETIKKADQVIKGLLDFSSISEMKMVPENLNSIIESSLLLIKNHIDRNRIEVIKDLKTDLPIINLDKNKIEQAFINIFLNSIDAMPNGGQLKIRTDTQETEKEGRVVISEIEDTGAGIPSDILDKIGEPFFTTKREKGGTGLGLSIVKNIVNLHYGKIKIENKKGSSGVRVTVMFKV